MSVYVKEKPEFLRQSLESIINQTVCPNEIIMIEDGELTQELYAVLDYFSSLIGEKFKRFVNEKNLGLGPSLQKGIMLCSNELIARMDTDDISKPNRCEKQLSVFSNDPDVDVVGANIEEFAETPDKIVSKRVVPSKHEDICEFLKKRNPFNHPSVMYKKQSVIKSGNYLDLYLYEDYYLWVRMFLAGCKFANIDECLVSMRISNMSVRRGGYKYFKSEKKLFKFMRKNKIVGWGAYLKAVIKRFIARVLIPNKLRQKLYKKYVRTN